ncbi:hypothetical protein KIPB_014029, partial [Kipferlia bialata]|eukprot:g14029.t1
MDSSFVSNTSSSPSLTPSHASITAALSRETYQCDSVPVKMRRYRSE